MAKLTKATNSIGDEDLRHKYLKGIERILVDLGVNPKEYVKI